MNFTAFDHECMSLALQLAKRGLNSTHPNPRVGCVIARSGKIVGSGWHVRAGEAHAEVVALAAAGDAARGASVYVSLEPCCHQGRTPPCTRALIEAGVAEVIYAIADPNPAVAGGGHAQLEAAGIPCRSGLLATEAGELNAGFCMRMRSGRPWVRLKLALSLDGRTALANGQSRWISGDEARQDVQLWRARSAAVMTGIGTVLADDPRLDLRLEGAERQPLRVIVDSRWRIPPAARILQQAGEVAIAGLADAAVPAALRESRARLLRLPADATGTRVDLVALLRSLGDLEVNELQVEAGEQLGGALLKARLVDELLIYQAPCLLGSGARGAFAIGVLDSMPERVELAWVERRMLGDCLRMRLRPQYPET